MTILTKCDKGYLHLGLRCGQVDENLNVQNLDQKHTCYTSQKADADSAVMFENLVACENENIKIIWEKLGGKPVGDSGEIRFNFIQWFDQKKSTQVDLTGANIYQLPNVFQNLKELNLSGNKRLFQIPDDLSVERLDLSGTNIFEVPHLKQVQKIVMLNTFAEIPSWLAAHDHQMQELVLDSKILIGDPPEHLDDISERINIVIGDYLQGSASYIKSNWHRAVERKTYGW